MARNKENYRIYRYDRMGGLEKLYRGNKGHDHATLKEAEEEAKRYLSKERPYGIQIKQLLIIRYGSNWNSEIIEIITKNKEDEIRQIEI